MIPNHITRAKLTEAFQLFGIDYADVISWSHDALTGWINFEMRPADTHPRVELILVRIPIVDAEPEPGDDLLGELKEAQG